MSAVWIDSGAARRAAGSWADRADHWFGVQFDLQGELAELRLGDTDPAVIHELAAACTEVWVNASFVRLVADRVESSDRLDAPAVERLRIQAGDHVQLALAGADIARSASHAFSSRYGDPAGTNDRELRSPYEILGSTAEQRGRNLVIRALTDTADSLQIRPDEFELVHLSTGKYLVVLPGVTDLSRPDLGLDDLHRTVRDVDQHAYPSSLSTSVADNRYARMVWDGLIEAAVPPGAELMIVGHSYGADTALDLAADPVFNGPAGFDVTHVVAAGYHVEPQLALVDPETEVLVLQNHRDMAVIVEAIGEGHVTGVVEQGRALFDSVAGFDPAGAVGHLAGVAYHQVGAVVDGASYLLGHSDSLVRASAGVLAGRPDWVREGTTDLITLDPGVERVTEWQTIDVFVGGGAGFGHDPANYVAHVAAATDPRVVAFLESIDRDGYARSGTAWAIDVSVPGRE